VCTGGKEQRHRVGVALEDDVMMEGSAAAVVRGITHVIRLQQHANAVACIPIVDNIDRCAGIEQKFHDGAVACSSSNMQCASDERFKDGQRARCSRHSPALVVFGT
jgi:hypothetical protein